VVLVYGEDVELGVGERDGNERAGLFPELSELYRETVALARRLDEAQKAAAEASGRDGSERVRVALTPAGRIGAVEIDVHWRSVLGVDGLPSAVLAAYREAGNRRVETWAAEIARTETDTEEIGPGVASPPVDTAAIGGSVRPGPADPSAHESIRQLWYVLQDATDRLDELARDFDTRSRTPVTGRDPGRHVTATLTGGNLTGVDIDTGWLAEASGAQIGAAITEAVAAGYAAADRLADDSMARRWPFADLERLTADPAALLRGLGLPHPGSFDESEKGD
jgi:DNA-binding protein YbaB